MWSVKAPDGTVPTGWVLMPLRLFLGVTFFYAGLQKLANPQFFKAASPISIHAQLVGASHSSPIHALITHLVPMASPVGAVIAVGEVAIGLGMLVGLLMRVAAVAGMALSFGLFLTVSFHSSPYFTGSDIVFFFAWTPVALAGAAGAPALDTWLASRRRESSDEVREGAVPRRLVLSTGAVAALAAGAVVVAGGLAAGLGRLAGRTSNVADSTTPTLGGAPSGSSTTTTTKSGSASPTTTTAAGTTTTPKGTAIGSSSGVPVGGSAAFTDPFTGNPSLVIQHEADHFAAFDAVCPHAGCTVAYQRAAKIIACPCHGSEFNAETGGLIRGPATRGLTPIPVAKGSNGDLYVT
jgi:thiosulfate dehydrogenase (quinone) large subunit